MKIITKDKFQHTQLTSTKTSENYSLSDIVSKHLGSKQLFIHHDIISPNQRSSGAHRHSLIEEVLYIEQGNATIVFGQEEINAEESSFVLFDPDEKKTHYVINRTDQILKTITFSLATAFDTVTFDNDNIDEPDLNFPSFKFNDELYEVPDSNDDWTLYFTELKDKLSEDIPISKKLSLFEQIGITARILQNYSEAELYLTKALALSYSYPKQSRLIQNFIRLAHLYQWKKEFVKSQVLFDQTKSLIYEAATSESLLASYHQHLGKLYFDQKLFGKAQSEFSTALCLRKRLCSPIDHIQSSKLSLDMTQKKWGRNLPEVFIRKAVPSDALAIHLAHMKSIKEICSKDYSTDEIQAWGHRPFIESQRLVPIKNHSVWVVEESTKVEGYAYLKVYEENGKRVAEVLGLYLTPKVLGKSLGKTLVALMLDEAKFLNASEVTLDATITAYDFYRKQGFVDNGPETMDKINGVPIRGRPMKLVLQTS
jgi:uncharacterized cupin superfamily protein/predicted GNAT family N-acyltransferase